MPAAKKIAPDFLSHDVREARRFYLDLGPADTGPLSVAAGGWESCAPHYSIQRSEFPYYSIEYVAGGRGSLAIGDRVETLTAGTIFTYGPGVPHRFASDPSEPLDKYFVDFRGRVAQKLLCEGQLGLGVCLSIVNGPRIRALWEELIAQGTHPSSNSQRATSLVLELLVLAMAQGLSADRKGGRARATLTRCQTYIDRNFLKIRTVDEVAAACFIDVAHLCRLFKKFVQQSPYRYLQRLQMNWAAEQLLVPGMFVREVADALGVDSFHFSRMFKRILGVSPQRISAAARRLTGAARRSPGDRASRNRRRVGSSEVTRVGCGL